MNAVDSSKDSKYSKTILIAEDEDVNYLFLEMLLQKINPDCSVLRAKDGKEAVDLYRTNLNIILVLMDIKMPNMDGYEATKLIKEYNPHAKVIAQTALTAYDAKEKALAAGCDDFITKPINKTLLASSMEQLLSSPI